MLSRSRLTMVCNTFKTRTGIQMFKLLCGTPCASVARLSLHLMHLEIWQIPSVPNGTSQHLPDSDAHTATSQGSPLGVRWSAGISGEFNGLIVDGTSLLVKPIGFLTLKTVRAYRKLSLNHFWELGFWGFWGSIAENRFTGSIGPRRGCGSHLCWSAVFSAHGFVHESWLIINQF